MYQIIQYIKFLFSSTNQHGVHSPFIFDLVTKCFYDKKQYGNYEKLRAYRKFLLKNNNSIEITDYGSGSRVFKSNKRQVSKIAKTSGTSLKRVKLLFRIANYFKPKEILELGTSLGIATQALALGNSRSAVTSIEGCDKTLEFATQQLRTFKIENVSLINAKFDDSFKKISDTNYDLVFIDGNHNGTSTLNYFEQLLGTVKNDSILIFDDIYWSQSMTDAWEIIKKHPEVTVTVDTFFWGMVFFRKEQVKEHFKIRV